MIHHPSRQPPLSPFCSPAAVRFLSCEPLLGPLEPLPLAGVHWVIVGNESGPGARPMRPERADGIRRQCEEAGGAFFFKQWGGVSKWRTGRVLNGRTYDAMPAAAGTAARGGRQPGAVR